MVPKWCPAAIGRFGRMPRHDRQFGWVSESFSKRFDDSTLDASLAFGFATMGSYGVSDHKNSFQTKSLFAVLGETSCKPLFDALSKCLDDNDRDWRKCQNQVAINF
ncbi:hypothetical protein AAMO2058_000573900 [Amorphochlora amoebiformis]